MHSIKEAVKYNVKWIEVDVKISKDNIPFLLHDNFLDRTTSGQGYPYDFTYKEINNLDAGSWFNNFFSFVYPPTLEEVLVYCSEKKIGLNIELKPNKGKEKENIEAVSYLLKKKKFDLQYFISSFDYLSLKLIRDKMKNVSIGYLIDNFNEKKNLISIIEDCFHLKCFAIGFNIKLVNKKLIINCKEKNLKIMVFSNKNISYKIALKLWNMGVDSIFIDNPIFYKKILNIRY